jgi:hypothetical protein
MAENGSGSFRCNSRHPVIDLSDFAEKILSAKQLRSINLAKHYYYNGRVCHSGGQGYCGMNIEPIGQ